ncbi:MAG TPA: 16S rRNA (cytidine(1402)-2'-O)-methyltransferase [Verrucomicrobiales bacterium]|nr:16S rRNA (cytidine(1402)-2'-O)-methyltransferase [Verrucomicrobiales bacterium]
MRERAGGTLFVVATPIGNLDDLSTRAEQCLRDVSLIACEDTRHTARLLSRYEIRTPKISLHAHNEQSRVEGVLERLRAGDTVALVSDAGIPGLCDPGQRLVASCRAAGCRVEALPGPCAPVTALAGSGFPADAFYFGGFLPNKPGGREKALRAALERQETSVFLESPHRLVRSLEALAALDAARPVCVARELTKIHEEYQSGRAAAVLEHFRARPPRGEIVLVLAGTRPPAWFRRIWEDAHGRESGTR